MGERISKAGWKWPFHKSQVLSEKWGPISLRYEEGEGWDKKESFLFALIISGKLKKRVSSLGDMKRGIRRRELPSQGGEGGLFSRQQ